MTHNKKGESDLCVDPNHHPPYEVMEHGVALVLPHTIVRMQVDMCLPQSMLLEEMVEHADDGIGSLPSIAGFINEVVDLPWNGFTTYPYWCYREDHHLAFCHSPVAVSRNGEKVLGRPASKACSMEKLSPSVRVLLQLSVECLHVKL